MAAIVALKLAIFLKQLLRHSAARLLSVLIDSTFRIYYWLLRTLITLERAESNYTLNPAVENLLATWT